jgi:hypothetical protein
LLCERQRRGQSSDPGTSDNDGARNRHGGPVRRLYLSARIPGGALRRP